MRGRSAPPGNNPSGNVDAERFIHIDHEVTARVRVQHDGAVHLREVAALGEDLSDGEGAADVLHPRIVTNVQFWHFESTGDGAGCAT